MDCFTCWSIQNNQAPRSPDGGDDGEAPSAPPAPPPTPADGDEGTSDVPPEAYGVRRFTFSELALATEEFGRDNFLGQGGFGKVFRGFLNQNPDKPVAVKMLNKEGTLSVDEFIMEVQSLYTLDHPNLVKLLGVCTDNEEKILVYDYMSQGSLDSWISNPDRRRNLTWRSRMEMAHDAAKGLLYLHRTSNPQTIHGNLKSENILLDGAFNAKLSDFGLAKCRSAVDRTPTSGRIASPATGYLDPEYFQNGGLSALSDVYSFGVILLELLTGRTANGPERSTLVELAKSNHHLDGRGKITGFADRLLGDRYPEDEFEQIVGVASKCIRIEPGSRPPMQEVVHALASVAVRPNASPPRGGRGHARRNAGLV